MTADRPTESGNGPGDGNKAFWQRFAGLYGPVMERSSGRLYAEVCRRLRGGLSRDMNVLEVACGTGQLSRALSSQVRLWEATDFSEAMIAEARKAPHSARLHFSVQNAEALPYGPESFDAVVIANALHVMPHPEQVLAELYRVLKPEGLLFAPTFVHRERRGLSPAMKLMELAGFRTYHSWSGDELTAFISAHGFSVVEQALLQGGLAPLCCVTARRLPRRDVPGAC